MNDIQAARLDAASDLAEADARCRATEHPDSTATAEDGRDARAARAEAQTRLDEANAALSADLAAKRLAYEEALREDREADAFHWISRHT